MVRNGEIALADVKRVFRKYWWITPFAVIGLAALGFIATLVLPKKYTSSTSVLVEPPAVSDKLVTQVVNTDLNQRLTSLKAQLLSSSQLEKIIDKFHLFPEERGKVPGEKLVGELQGAIDVELLQPMPGAVNRTPPGFKITVTYDNPKTAQEICAEISSMFTEQSKLRSLTQGKDTTEFLTDQLTTAKGKMDEEGARLAQFKREHLGSLPEEEQANLQQLTNLNTQLESANQATNRAEQDRAFNQTMLEQAEANYKQMLSGNQNPDTLEAQLSALQDQLTNMLTRYTEDHPDVIKLKAQIDDVKRRMAIDPTTTAATTKPKNSHEPPQLQQLRGRIKQDEMSIAEMTRRQAQIQDQIRTIQGRVQSSPMVEEQFKELTRNSQAATDIYNDLMKKRATAAMGTDLQERDQSESFTVLDAPSFPSSPSFPKMPIFVGGGAAAGLLVALAILYALAMADRAMYSERDVEKALKLPVLTSVPSLDAAASNKTKAKTHKPSDFEAAVALKA